MFQSSTWICHDCNIEVEWTMKDVADKGTPVCPKCDCDLELKDEKEDIETKEEIDSEELMQKFIDDEHLHFEGQQAIESLNKIAARLGYKEEGYRYGTSFEQFIQDNSGCCEEIINWITFWMDKNPEWKEAMKLEEQNAG
jgi:hypothetical protein